MPNIDICDHAYDRYDLMEFRAQVVPLAHAQVALTDKNWRFLLSAVGVSDISACNEKDGSAMLNGKFDTYPEHMIKMRFEKDTNDLFAIANICIKQK